MNGISYGALKVSFLTYILWSYEGLYTHTTETEEWTYYVVANHGLPGPFLAFLGL